MLRRGNILPVALLAIILVFAVGSSALADDYSGHWSAQFINDAASRGWMTGDGSGNFRPESSITRGEFAVMLWRALGQPKASYACTFLDVAADAFYFEAVKALYEAGIVTGLNAATFAPNMTLTREMGCTMLARAYKLSAVNINAYQQFADYAQISDWARAAISALVEKNYIAGVGENKIAPKQQLKRGEMAKLLITVFDGVKTAQTAFLQQQEATAAIIQYFSGPTISVEQIVLGSDKVRVKVTATDDRGVTFVGWRTSSKDANYRSKDGFNNDITGSLEFTLDKNGWYAVYSENKGGYGSFKLFEVTTIREDAPIVNLSQSTNAVSGLVEITISVTKVGGGAVTDYTDYYLGYRTAKEGNIYSSKSGFDDKDIVNRILTIDPAKDYGWYAICAVDPDGNFGYRLIEIEKANTNCVVTFDAVGGSPTPAKQTVDYNTKLTKPTDPTKTGYIFDGWYNGATEWNFDDRVTKDMTLKANWVNSATEYTITATAGTGGSATGGDTYAHGTDVTLTATPNIGYDFEGWYENETKISGAGVTYTFKATANRTLEARFTLKTYTLSYDENGENVTNMPSSVTVDYNEAVSVSGQTPERGGYTFMGWATSSTGAVQYSAGESIDTVTENITLFAVWA